MSLRSDQLPSPSSTPSQHHKAPREPVTRAAGSPTRPGSGGTRPRQDPEKAPSRRLDPAFPCRALRYPIASSRSRPPRCSRSAVPRTRRRLGHAYLFRVSGPLWLQHIPDPLRSPSSLASPSPGTSHSVPGLLGGVYASGRSGSSGARDAGPDAPRLGSQRSSWPPCSAWSGSGVKDTPVRVFTLVGLVLCGSTSVTCARASSRGRCCSGGACDTFWPPSLRAHARLDVHLARCSRRTSSVSADGRRDPGDAARTRPPRARRSRGGRADPVGVSSC